MKVISVNAGKSKTVQWKNQTITTSIYKSPMAGTVAVNKLGLETDTQSDLNVHGGVDKAVYAYPSEHYVYWEKELPHFEFEWGTFGENLSVEGLLESEVRLGNRYKIGSVELEVSQPRFPCNKLAMRFDDPFMVKQFLASRRSGIYFRVLTEGNLEAGDLITLIQETDSVTIREFVDLYADKEPEAERIERILNDPYLMDDWRDYFQSKLARVS